MYFSMACRKCSQHLLKAVNLLPSKSPTTSPSSLPLARVLVSKQKSIQHYTTQSSEETSDAFQGGGGGDKKLPLMLNRQFKFPVEYGHARQAWVESMDSLDGTKLGMVDLHPDVFATLPRTDVLHYNIKWQEEYKKIDYLFENNRAEMPGGGRKPWPQKGLGRARHGSCRSPIWKHGGKANGPRGPKSGFFMLPRDMRAYGLRIALTCKYHQNDLVIVDNLEIPTPDPQWLLDLTDVRFWGFSVLFVDDTDIMPENVSEAIQQTTGFTLMPAYGLNVHSMLKHDTLVMTLAAVERVEAKLLEEMRTSKADRRYVNTLTPEDFRTAPPIDETMYKQFTHPLELDRDFYNKPQFKCDKEDEPEVEPES